MVSCLRACCTLNPVFCRLLRSETDPPPPLNFGRIRPSAEMLCGGPCSCLHPYIKGGRTFMSADFSSRVRKPALLLYKDIRWGIVLRFVRNPAFRGPQKRHNDYRDAFLVSAIHRALTQSSPSIGFSLRLLIALFELMLDQLLSSWTRIGSGEGPSQLCKNYGRRRIGFGTAR